MKVHLCKYCMNNSLSYITQYARYTYYVYVLLILHVISTLKLQKTLYKPPKTENRSEWNGSNLSISRAFLMECFLLLRLTKFFIDFWSYLNYWCKMCQKCWLLLFFICDVCYIDVEEWPSAHCRSNKKQYKYNKDNITKIYSLCMFWIRLNSYYLKQYVFSRERGNIIAWM